MQVDRINLLPKNLRPSPINPQSVLIAGWLVCAAIMVLGASFKFWQLEKSKTQYEQLSETAKSLDLKVQEIAKREVAGAMSGQRINQTRLFLASKINWAAALKELSLLVPKTVWLTNFSIKTDGTGKPFIELLGSASSQQKIAGFLNSLEMSYYFRDVSLRKSEKIATISPDLYKFQFEVAIPQLIARGPNEKAQ